MTTEVLEAKPLGVRVNPALKDRFSGRATDENLSQQDLLEKVLRNYLDDPTPSPPINPTAEVSDNRQAFEDAVSTIQKIATDLECEIKRLKTTETGDAYKKSLKEIAEDAATVTSLLSSFKRLQDVISLSHRQILEASESAAEPFQKIVLDQAEQAKRLEASYEKIAQNVLGLEKAASDALAKSERITRTLDHEVTNSVVQSVQNVFKKSEKYLDDRNGFLKGLMIAVALSTIAAAGSLYYSGFIVKAQTDETRGLAQWCSQFYDQFTSASCQFRKLNKADQIQSLMKIPSCK